MRAQVLYCLYLDYLDGECFVDSADRILSFEAKNDNQMTIKMCKQLCFEDNNYVYAGVQYSSYCFCGNDKPITPAPDSDCSMTCSGDSSKMCGGQYRHNIYQKPAFVAGNNYINISINIDNYINSEYTSAKKEMDQLLWLTGGNYI